jgi:capsular polysaccharide transport system permease protein
MTEPAPKVAPGPKPVEPTGNPPAQDPSSQSKRSAAQQVRIERARRLAFRLGLGVVLPTLLAAVYYIAIDTRQYESVATFTIESADGQNQAALQGLLSTVGSTGAGKDAQVIRSYILSRDMFEHLSEKHGLVSHFSQSRIDWLSRLGEETSFEDRYEYYQDVVDAEYDSNTGLVTVRVRGFNAHKAEDIAQAILKASEQKVNHMMQQARQDRVALAEREVKEAEKRLVKAREKVRELQAERSELDPSASAKAALQVKSSLETKLAEARAKLNAMRATLQPGTPKLQTQQQKVAGLRQQVRQQQGKLAGRGDGALHADIAALEPAITEKQFAQKAYESAVKSLELARLEADRQHRYLSVVSEPSAPDAPTHPKVGLAVLTVFVLAFALMSIGSLLLASIREHANI